MTKDVRTEMNPQNWERWDHAILGVADHLQTSHLPNMCYHVKFGSSASKVYA